MRAPTTASPVGRRDQQRHTSHSNAASAAAAPGAGSPVRDGQFMVSTPFGFHLRPATMLVKTASSFDSTITLRGNGSQADAKSLMSVLLLGLVCGTVVTVTAEGHDACKAMTAIGRLFLAGFGETDVHAGESCPLQGFSA